MAPKWVQLANLFTSCLQSPFLFLGIVFKLQRRIKHPVINGGISLNILSPSFTTSIECGHQHYHHWNDSGLYMKMVVCSDESFDQKGVAHDPPLWRPQRSACSSSVTDHFPPVFLYSSRIPSSGRMSASSFGRGI